MRKIILSLMVSVDGYIEGTDHDLSWHMWNEEMANMKHQKGKDFVMFGGADLASSFMHDNLFDQYNLIVYPVVLGAGTLLFKNPELRPELKLLRSRQFSCGNVLLSYHPK